MEKYRIKEKKTIYHYPTIDRYSAGVIYIVQRRVLKFFWINIDSFQEKEVAESYKTAFEEIAEMRN